MLLFGQYVIPEDQVHHIDLKYARPQTEGGGTMVRVWLRQNSTLQQGGQPPAYLDFGGTDAVAVRRWCTKRADSGGLTEVISAEHLDTPATKTAVATARAGGRR